MDKDLATVIFVTVIGVLVVVIPQNANIIWSIAFVVGVVIAGIVYYSVIRSIEKKDENSPYPAITLHFPYSTVTKENYHTYTPDFICNENTWQAYPLSKDVLQLCVRNRGIKNFIPYPDSSILKSALGQFHTLHQAPAKLEDLGIIIKRDNRTLMVEPTTINPEQMTKLIEQKNAGAFKNLRLVFLHSVHIIKKSKKDADFPTNRRLIIDLDKRTARQPPLGHLWMWKAELFEVKEYRKILPCTLGVWCFFYEFWKNPLRPIRFKRNDAWDISELLNMKK